MGVEPEVDNFLITGLGAKQILNTSGLDFCWEKNLNSQILFIIIIFLCNILLYLILNIKDE
jgi:hypothetical protein